MLWISFLFGCILFFFFKQKTAYEMRISDWSSDVCSSDLIGPAFKDHTNDAERRAHALELQAVGLGPVCHHGADRIGEFGDLVERLRGGGDALRIQHQAVAHRRDRKSGVMGRSVSVRVILGVRSIMTNKRTEKVMPIRRSNGKAL